VGCVLMYRIALRTRFLLRTKRRKLQVAKRQNCRRRPNPGKVKQIQVSMKRLLQLAIALAAVFVISRGAGWYLHRQAILERRKPILAELDRLQAHYYYDYQLVDADSEKLVDANSLDVKQDVLSRIFGREFCHDLFYVTFAKFSSHRKDGSVAAKQSNIDDKALAELVQELQELKWLALIGTGVTDAGIAKLRALPSLERVWLSQTQITDAGIQQLSDIQSLTHLAIEATPTSDRCLVMLSKLPKLKSLSIGSPYFSPDGLRQLQSLKALEHLYLDRLPLDDQAAQAIGELKRLRTLSIRQTAITDIGLRALVKLENLHELHIDGCRITDDGLNAARNWKDLEILTLTNTPIGDRGIKMLGNCKKLKSLRVNHSACTLPGILELFQSELNMELPKALQAVFETKLDQHGNVVSINLSPVQINDADVDLLAQLPELQWLEMQPSNLTDEGAAKIVDVGFPKLQLLKIDQSKITDTGFRSLCRLKKLRDIHLRGTAVSPAAVEEAVANNNSLRVYLAEELARK
jgi:internalin A